MRSLLFSPLLLCTFFVLVLADDSDVKTAMDAKIATLSPAAQTVARQIQQLTSTSLSKDEKQNKFAEIMKSVPQNVQDELIQFKGQIDALVKEKLASMDGPTANKVQTILNKINTNNQ